MSNLVEFVLARIAEREAVAREAACAVVVRGHPEHLAGARWNATDCGHGTAVVSTPAGDLWDNEGSWTLSMAAPAAAHIALNDPARVLAECEAKRRIVTEAQESLTLVGGYIVINDSWSGRQDAYDEVMRLLALPYADHPEWREEWRL